MMLKFHSFDIIASLNRSISLLVLDHILDALGDVVNILGGDAAHRDAAILCHVNAMLLHHCFALLHCEAREGEHSDLVGDMIPPSRCAKFF